MAPPPNPQSSTPGAFLEGDQAVSSGTAGAKRQIRKGRARGAREWIFVVAGALLVAFVVRGFVLQSFWIPSGSMEPTLQIKDRVLVNRLAYKAHPIHRGDVVVFARPPGISSDPNVKDLIKRVIGLPGETIEFSEDRVLVDGRLLNEPYLPAGVPTRAKKLGPKIVVPQGQILVLGDNRENSNDGRFFGPIDKKLVVGRAFVMVWPFKHVKWL
jgi:signal peptidase I